MLAMALAPALVTGQTPPPTQVPAACTDGVVTSLTLDRKSVFDPESTDVGALAWTYRVLNLFHVRTAASFVRRELLFEEGDCFDPFLVAESERLLDLYEFVAQAEISYEEDTNGDKLVTVSTQDEWSTQVDVGVTYEDGLNLERLQLTEKNFLGQGIFGEFTHRDRREVKSQAFGVSTPRFFGRADVSVFVGRDRPGRFVNQYFRYPFVGETGRLSFRQGYDRGTTFFSYSTDGAEPFSQVLVPASRELMELSLMRRLGELGRSVLVGVSVTRDVVDFPRAPEVVVGTNFDDAQPWVGALPPVLDRQLRSAATTRVGVHLGARRVRYAEYVGLDAVRERQIVDLGVFGGVTVGRGFDFLAPDDVAGRSDSFARARATFGVPVGSSLFFGWATGETRRSGGAWRDVIAEADLVAYLRSRHLSGHTFFVRASAAGGWNTQLPFQLTLGGREVVRSLVEDRYPGGRMTRFVFEDRIVFPWPAPGDADLGLTVLADVGRVFPGDVPYGVDSGWQTGVGLGLRIGLPAGTRNVLRTDLILPTGGTGGDPIFRITAELNQLRAGFFTMDIFRSRRLELGPDHF